MERAGEAWKTFEALKADLLRSHPGRFAFLAGDKLLGTFPSIDDAFAAVSEAFDRGLIAHGKPVLVVQITERVDVSVTAQPYPAASGIAA
jgi:hypothetical protein